MESRRYCPALLLLVLSPTVRIQRVFFLDINTTPVLTRARTTWQR